MSAIERYRKDLHPHPAAVWPTAISFGAIFAGLSLENPLICIPAIVILIASGIWAWRSTKVNPQLEVVEYRSGDYPTLLLVAKPFIPLIASFPASWLAIDSLQSPLAGALAAGTAHALGLSVVLRSGYQVQRVGNRRLKRLLQTSSLEGVTTSGVNAAEAHGDFLAAMVACGAVDGVFVRDVTLSALLDAPEAEIREDMDLLDKAELVKTRWQYDSHGKRRPEASLTPLAVKTISAARSR
ncbi:hypothetical protein [Corynebacterium tapiri]|uniref:Uncharacterized protein n=1 Tax=Corynebacterium tapiri TaxID=1448266 RepID=A0A5C4U2E8_9CORY|nr:hypothetical protein [Corynebacterium tapiri]TNL96647.1 hypothetical protein FHE74_08085 [Corynebacterium tapiri]